jgi:hypothetical protein
VRDGDEARRALCAFETEGLPGAATRGEGEGVIDDDGVSVAGLRVEFLDADDFADEKRVLILGLHPSGTLRISRLGRRHETFSRALSDARDAARVRGLLAHGLGVPEAFARAVRKAHADMLERCARACGTRLFADGRLPPGVGRQPHNFRAREQCGLSGNPYDWRSGTEHASPVPSDTAWHPAAIKHPPTAGRNGSSMVPVR